MRELVEAIRARGVGVGTDIVKVDMFLNHRLDTDLFVKMGQAFAEAFAQEKPDLVLTVEASGIAAALTTAMACGNIPVVFAKKSRTRNVTGDVYESRVFSFTHGVENHIRVAKDYLPKGARLDRGRFPGQRRGRRGPVRPGPAGGGHGGGHRHLRGKELSAGSSEAGGGRVSRGFPGQGYGHPRRQADRGGLKSPTKGARAFQPRVPS